MKEIIENKIKEFSDAVLEIAESTQEYIEAHNSYIGKHLKDATLIKEKVKEKLIGVINEDK